MRRPLCSRVWSYLNTITTLCCHCSLSKSPSCLWHRPSQTVWTTNSLPSGTTHTWHWRNDCADARVIIPLHTSLVTSHRRPTCVPLLFLHDYLAVCLHNVILSCLQVDDSRHLRACEKRATAARLPHHSPCARGAMLRRHHRYASLHCYVTGPDLPQSTVISWLGVALHVSGYVSVSKLPTSNILPSLSTLIQ